MDLKTEVNFHNKIAVFYGINKANIIRYGQTTGQYSKTRYVLYLQTLL
jgi:hypothetical protein